MKIVQVTNPEFPNKYIPVGDGTQSMKVRDWLQHECIRRKKHGQCVWIGEPDSYGRIAIYRKE